MTPEEVGEQIRSIHAHWPQSITWPPYVTAEWSAVMKKHGPSFGQAALRVLARDEDFKSFPPGLAAYEQVLERLEYRLREHRLYFEERLAAALSRGDEEDAEKAERSIQRINDRLAV